MTYEIAEIAVALLAAGGLLLVCWLLFGRIIAPVGEDGAPVCIVVPVRGDGGGMEYTISGLKWLRDGGLARFTVILADYGLDETGLAKARLLMDQEPALRLCPAAHLEQHIKDITRNGCF